MREKALTLTIDANSEMTIQEITRRARVPIAIVSRTTNQVPSVRSSLARRVHELIQQVGYYPNSNARAPVSGRSRIFGLMVLEITNLGFANQYEIFLCFTSQDPE
jgi:DNA-binding LacI/PurR family transcriptional regulator